MCSTVSWGKSRELRFWSRWEFKLLGIGGYINSDEFVGKVRGRKIGPGIIDSKGVEAADLEILEAN